MRFQSAHKAAPAPVSGAIAARLGRDANGIQGSPMAVTPSDDGPVAAWDAGSSDARSSGGAGGGAGSRRADASAAVSEEAAPEWESYVDGHSGKT